MSTAHLAPLSPRSKLIYLSDIIDYLLETGGQTLLVGDLNCGGDTPATLDHRSVDLLSGYEWPGSMQYTIWFDEIGSCYQSPGPNRRDC